jgi:hypothetical protein
LRRLRERNILWTPYEKRNGALIERKETHGQEKDEDEEKKYLSWDEILAKLMRLK